jgi:transcription initiation factor TFIIB
MPENVLLPKSSLGTSISYGKKDETSQKINMLQQWNSMPYSERSLYKVFENIQSVCKSNNLPEKISTTAKSLYSIISKTKISRGNNRKGIIAACVYHACKECNVPRSINELAHMFSIQSTVMTKGCKNYTEIMRMSKMNRDRIFQISQVSLYDFIDRFSSKLSLSEEETKKIHYIAKLCEINNMINDNTPPSMASGCIYMYCKLKENKITKKDISDICKISEVTINKCYKKLELNQEILKQSKEII